MPIAPWFDSVRSRFMMSHTLYGAAQGTFARGTGSFYGLYGKFLLLNMVMVIDIIGLGVLATLAFDIDVGNLEEGATAYHPLGVIISMVAVYIMYFYIGGYYRARLC